MLLTTATSAVCFYSNTFLVLLVVREFWIFMGTVVLLNFVHTVTILPSALLASNLYLAPFWGRVVGRARRCCPGLCRVRGDGESLDSSRREAEFVGNLGEGGDAFWDKEEPEAAAAAPAGVEEASDRGLEEEEAAGAAATVAAAPQCSSYDKRRSTGGMMRVAQHRQQLVLGPGGQRCRGWVRRSDARTRIESARYARGVRGRG